MHYVIINTAVENSRYCQSVFFLLKFLLLWNVYLLGSNSICKPWLVGLNPAIPSELHNVEGWAAKVTDCAVTDCLMAPGCFLTTTKWPILWKTGEGRHPISSEEEDNKRKRGGGCLEEEKTHRSLGRTRKLERQTKARKLLNWNSRIYGQLVLVREPPGLLHCTVLAYLINKVESFFVCLSHKISKIIRARN